MILVFTSRHNFRAVLGDNLVFLSRSGNHSVVSNCLNFFITECSIDQTVA